MRPTPIRLRLPLVASAPYRARIPPPPQAKLPRLTEGAPQLANTRVVDLINQHAPEDSSQPMREIAVPQLVEVGLQWPSLLQFIQGVEVQLPPERRLEVESQMMQTVAMDSPEDYVRVFDVMCAGIDRVAMVKPFLQRVAAAVAPHDSLAVVVELLAVIQVDVWLEVISATHWHSQLTPKLVRRILAECQAIGVVGEMRRYQAMWQIAGTFVEQHAWPVVELLDDDVRIPMTSMMCEYIEATDGELRPFVKAVANPQIKDVVRSWQMRASVRANVDALGPLIHYHRRHRRRFGAIIPTIIGGLIDQRQVSVAEKLLRVRRALTMLDKHGYAVDWPDHSKSQLLHQLSQASQERCHSPEVRRHLEYVSEVMLLRGHPVVELALRG